MKALHLSGQDLKAELHTRLTKVRQGGRDEDDNEPTDSWTSKASSAGQRAIHLGRQHKGWAVVPPTGLQRSVAAASAQLKQKLGVRVITCTASLMQTNQLIWKLLYRELRELKHLVSPVSLIKKLRITVTKRRSLELKMRPNLGAINMSAGSGFLRIASAGDAV